jgi:hypothetical protein
MSDQFQNHQRGLDSPGERHLAITPHDTDPVVPRPRALWCNAGGALVLEDAAGTALTYLVQPGQIIPFRAVKVRATGTTATVFGWD